MPEHLRAFIVVLVMGFAALVMLARPLGPVVGVVQFRRWKTAWLFVTAAAFLSNNFWIYTILLVGLVVWLRPRPLEASSLFLLLLFAVPSSGINVPGMGVINYLFEINHHRLLALVLLLPAFFRLAFGGVRRVAGVYPTDKWFFAFLILTCLLQFRQSTFTDALRSCFLIYLDLVLPYYVFSRSISEVKDFKLLLSAYVVAAVIMGGLGLFEMLRTWNLYAALVSSLDTSWGYIGYLLRDGLQRASVSTGQAIAYGYAMVVALGFWLYLKGFVARGLAVPMVMAAILLGLLSSLSRGPWLGALVLYAAFMLTAPGGIRTMIGRGVVVLALLPLVMVTPWGDRIIGMLPFVGNVDVENIDYRSRLIDASMAVIERNFLLGSPYYIDEPEMRAMVQGQGIIDVVNSYLAVALGYGFLGLFLFFMIFVGAVVSIYRTVIGKVAAAGVLDDKLLARCLFAVLLSVMFMIFTVSSITIIPIVYWSLLGMCAAYVCLLRARGFAKK